MSLEGMICECGHHIDDHKPATADDPESVGGCLRSDCSCGNFGGVPYAKLQPMDFTNKKFRIVSGTTLSHALSHEITSPKLSTAGVADKRSDK